MKNKIDDDAETVDKKPKSIFIFLNSISYNKDNPFEYIPEKDYNPYMINRWLSFSVDTAMYAQEMNQKYHLPKHMQFDYLRFSIRKKRRRFNYESKIKEDKIILIKEYFNYSYPKAKEIMELLSDNDFKEIKQFLDKGGIR